MDGRTLCPIVPFDLIYDKNIGIVRFLQQIIKNGGFQEGELPSSLYQIEKWSAQSRNKNSESLNRLKRMNDKDIFWAVHDRSMFDPLSSVVPTTMLKNSLECSELLCSTYEKDILDLSPFTDFGYVIIVGSTRLGGIKPYIWCKTDLEEEKIKNTKELDNCIIDKGGSLYSISRGKVFYDPYYIDVAIRLDEFPNGTLLRKNIYVSNIPVNQAYLEKINNDPKRSYLTKNNAVVLSNIWREENFKNHGQ